ncbi:glucose-inhibited division protein A [Nodosilinea sp. LEGE 07088]|uniref:hypothetical protein n=1 Tax=Nodosilinea sp. LEGE 07088 TaxID=2777968 RepID=UPI00187FBAA4|nr:hypothetical protein [Nodosilinea sp. LEGE 07088]MBE9138333.1 glucose-inhibited division protein A [Nodosilinea sp. LEGE 07088]
MDRSKLIAILTGAISLLLAMGYLILVQMLDFRGDMVPAPLSSVPLFLSSTPSLGSMVSQSFF